MRSITEYLESYTPAIANLGCGKNNPDKCYGVDIQEMQGVDLVADLNVGIPLPNDTFDFVLAQDFLEHIDQKNCIQLMEEIYRILKPGGTLVFEVPSTDGNNQGAFCDPTHFSFWNQYKFKYFMDEQFTEGQRALYNIRCWFHPKRLETFLNTWNCTYVRGELQKVI